MILTAPVLQLVFLLALLGGDPDPAAVAVAAFDASFAGEPATLGAAVRRGLVIQEAGDVILALPAGKVRSSAFRALADRIAATKSDEVAVAAHNILARGFFLEAGADEVRAALLAVDAELSARARDRKRSHRRRCAIDALSWRTDAPKTVAKPWPDPRALVRLVDHIEEGEWGSAWGLVEQTPILAIPDEDTAGRILEAFWRRQYHAERLITLVRPAERLGRMLADVAVMMSDTRDEKILVTCERVLRRGAINSSVLTPDQAFEAISPALLQAMEAGPHDNLNQRATILLARIPSILAIRALIKAIREGVTHTNMLQMVGHPDAVQDLLALLSEEDHCGARGIIRALGNCGAPGKVALRKILEETPGFPLVGLETFCPLVTSREDFELVNLAAVRFEAEWRRLHGEFRGKPDMVARMWRIIRGRTTYCAANPEAARAAVDFLDRHPGARIEQALFDILRKWPPEIVAPFIDELANSRPNEKELIRELRKRQAEER